MRPHAIQQARRYASSLPPAALILATLAVAVQWTGAWAQSAGRPGYRSDARNPFELASPIIARLNEGEAKVGFQASDGGFKVPNMKLRGMVLRQDGAKAALLEIRGIGTYVVREGETIGINAASPNAVVRVKRIDRMQVEVEAGSMRQIIIVR